MPNNKLETLKRLSAISAKLKAKGKIIVTTNGIFDLLHPGHVRYLQHAKALGDVLMVGINSDASTRRLKGGKRPINPQEDRAEVLSALESVDYACIFNERTPEKFLAAIRPAIHVKGGDYAAESLPEKRVVEKYGGKVLAVKLQEGYSTSSTIEKILKKYSK